jgi:hypothetical protein
MAGAGFSQVRAGKLSSTGSDMTTPRAIRPGDELDGFVIEAIAGRGGMGVVFRARQKQPDRAVALKVIAADLADDPKFRSRFQREATLAAQIEHPNVIPVYAVGEADGVLYLAMRFVDGIDMRALLVQQGRLEPRQAAAIIDQVAQALDSAHSRGLVHRDVKPANILITTAGGRQHVYLSDFGLSRHVEGSQGLTGTGAFLGTIDYVAPEQARGEAVDARTDVYSLGCVLFQALTGSVPYPMDNDLAKLYAHDSQPPPSVLERAPDTPAAFESVLKRAMNKDPDERYLSAGDLGRAAVAAAAGEVLSRAERSVAAGVAAPGGAGPVTSERLTRTVAPAGSGESTVAGDLTAPATKRRSAATDQLPAAHSDEPNRAASPSAGRARGWTGRPRLLGAGVLAAAGVVAAVVVIATGGSTTSRPTSAVSVRSDNGPVLTAVAVRRTAAPGGLHYRLELAKAPTSPTTSPETPVSYYFNLWVGRGNGPLMHVQRLKLPFIFTASSFISSFTLDSEPTGIGNVGLSWFVKNGDTSTVTHYFTLMPTGIAVDS